MRTKRIATVLVRERTRELVWHVIGAERPNRRAQVAAALTSLGAELAAPACRPETLFQLIPPSAPHQRQGRGQRSDCRQLISRTMSSAAVNAAIRLAIETDRFPHAPRLDPLRAPLAKLEPAPSSAGPRPKAQWLPK